MVSADMLLPLVRQDRANSYQSQGTDMPYLPEMPDASEDDSAVEPSDLQGREEV